MDKRKINVLVTGATGFIGNHLVNELLLAGYTVTVASRRNKNELEYNWLSNINYVKCDLNKYNIDFYHMFGKPDVVIHLAWEGLPNYNKIFHIERNLPSSFSFIKQLVSKGTKKVIVAGTCFEYGLQNGSLSEITKCEPVTAYGLAKDCLRRFLDKLRSNYDFDLIWIRIFYPYGLGQGPNSLLSKLSQAIKNGDDYFNLSPGDQLRDYINIEKVALYIVRILSNAKETGIINCCSGIPISVKSLVEEFIEQNNSKIKLNFGYYNYPDYEPKEFWGDTTKLERAIR